MNVFKVVLKSGKEVLLREPSINDGEMAAQLAAPRAGDNPFLLQMFAQKELLKLLLVSVDGKKITAKDAEGINEMFNPGEYGTLLKVLNKVGGGDEAGKDQLPGIELVTSGER